MTPEDIAARALDNAVRLSIAKAHSSTSSSLMTGTVTEIAETFERWIKNAASRQSPRNR